MERDVDASGVGEKDDNLEEGEHTQRATPEAASGDDTSVALSKEEKRHRRAQERSARKANFLRDQRKKQQQERVELPAEVSALFQAPFRLDQPDAGASSAMGGGRGLDDPPCAASFEDMERRMAQMERRTMVMLDQSDRIGFSAQQQPLLAPSDL